MNREEIIDELCRLRSDIVNAGGYVNRTDAQKNRFASALSEGILSLQTEPCGKDINVPATDAISRQVVYQELSLLLSDWDDDYNKVISKCLQAIDNVPSVQPKQKIGHWIPRNSFLVRYKCSECEFESEEYNYCPNCGAKMEGGE